MDAAKKLAVKTYRHFIHDSLYRNSFFLMTNTACLAIFGFIFWALAARFYSTTNVGIVATLVSAANFIAILSTLGFDTSFIRYLPRSKFYAEQLDTGFMVSSLAAVFVSVIYLLVIKLILPGSLFIDNSLFWGVAFVIFMVINMLNNLTNIAFIAYRKSHYLLIINLIFGILRLVALVLLSRYKLGGIVLSYALAASLTLLLTIAAFRRYLNYHVRPRIIKRELKRLAKYSFINYISTLFSSLPTLLLPTVIIKLLSPSFSAYYYIVSVIVAAILIIPQSSSQALFAEGSWDTIKLPHYFIKASKMVFPSTIGFIALIIVLAKPILEIFGRNYADHGLSLLILLSLAVVLKTASSLVSVILKIYHIIIPVAVAYVAYAVVILAGSIWGLPRIGLDAIGYATLAAELLVLACLGFTLFLLRHQKISPKEVRLG
ncbi:MAG TPA: oligosaccharide flippase family protein [Candidatus Saccharimonadales bacterium]|nr:oligosaccharide flippase family protein [Candidatus Saccharimonadales bacterium]